MVEENKPNTEEKSVASTPPDPAPEEKPVACPPPDPTPELSRLIELATKYPEIGPPLAELAFKIGQPEFGNRVVRMGLEQEGPGLEYYFVAAHSARREHRFADARRYSVDAVKSFGDTDEAALAADDGTRLLHLVRLGYSTLLFDEKNAEADPQFVEGLSRELPRVEERLGAEAFFHAMVAQTAWYDDRGRSEQAWERAAELGEAEFTWNARGTWYKEAEHDNEKAESAYRKGLEEAPTSALLLHNIAQLLVEKAGRSDVDLDSARRLLREAEQQLRAALREEGPKGLRRHIHETRDRLSALRASFPPRAGESSDQRERGGPAAEPEKEPEVGEVLCGRVSSLTVFGAFVSLPGRGTGLLHKSEIAHEPVEVPAEVLKVGDEVEVKVIDVRRKEGERQLRVALSRKALLPIPEGWTPTKSNRAQGGTQDRGRDKPRKDEGRRGERQEPRRPRREGRPPARAQVDKPRDDKLASLGEMLLAKMQEQNKKA